ncbi:MAG TPA: DegV family protein [Candidatus Cryosericum sp.]|nr:DegV family protein [Candidatus Cryosericum sp.]
MSYTIFTDSSANLTKETLTALDILVVSLTYTVDGEEHLCYDPNVEFDGNAFYTALKNPAYHVRTSMINADTFRRAFEQALSKGEDVLYLAMSSGISGTCQAAANAAEELKELYPERRIEVVDTLAASLGEGLMVCRASLMRHDGKSLDEVIAWVKEARTAVCQHFLVDDLMYLNRGGRMSGATALVGTMLQIKPLMKSQEGKIVLNVKVPGRKKALRTLADIFDRTVVDPQSQTIGIAHGACESDALALRDMISEKHQIEDFMIVCYEPGTGAHVGPGTVALFYYGRDEKPESFPAALLKKLDLDSGRLRAFVNDKIKLLTGEKNESHRD